MDLGAVAGTYVHRLVEGGGERPRILLLDNETTGIISLCATQSQLLKNDVFLVDRVDTEGRQKMRHLDCTCFVRPTNESISALVEELRNPKYGSYSLVFSNTLKKSQLERLAESDDHEAVSKVLEMYCDMYIINKDFFSAQVPVVYGADPDSWLPAALDRSVDCLVAVLLSLKAKPLIRYEANSGMCRRLAADVSRNIQQHGQLFDFSARDAPPVLLLLDRRNDPVTALLTHWTYQAMVDEVLGIKNNLVQLQNAPGISKDLEEIVLAQDQDAFFAETMFLNFGDLGARIRDYVSQYQEKTHSNAKIESVADMKRFVEEYPEFRKLSGNVSKHVALVGELSRQVDLQGLLDVSEVEQSLACTDSHSRDLSAVQALLSDPKTSPLVKYRLVALYALRYGNHSQNSTSALLGLIESVGAGEPRLRHAIDALINVYSGLQKQQDDSLSAGSLLSRAQLGLKGLKGIENVYTQHKPLLEQTLRQLIRGKLKKQKYPFYDPGDHSLPVWALHGDDTEPPQDVIVFIVGGVTYEEARLVSELNSTSRGVRITLGGTDTVNSDSLLNMLANSDWPVRRTATDRLRNFGRS